MNLITNAIKYNESAKPRIDISFDKKAGRALIRFEDNGVGLEKGEIKKIFKKFYQIGRYRKNPLYPLLLLTATTELAAELSAQQTPSSQKKPNRPRRHGAPKRLQTMDLGQFAIQINGYK